MLDRNTLTDADLAATLAVQAGHLLMHIRNESGLADTALGDAGDRQANNLILAALARHRPGDAILSEESADSGDRLGAERVWIIDPLDGTREYRQGRDDFAVHVGLSVNGAPAVGAVGLPPRDIVLRSDTPPALPAEAAKLRIATSRTRPAPIAAAIARRVGAECVRIGSAGAKTAAVILGQADAYIHTGEQSEWDNCAPVAVALAAGLHCSRIDGSPLRYNRRNVIVPDLLICHRHRAAQFIALAREESGG